MERARCHVPGDEDDGRVEGLDHEARERGESVAAGAAASLAWGG